jgi:hypothetical protein
MLYDNINKLAQFMAEHRLSKGPVGAVSGRIVDLEIESSPDKSPYELFRFSDFPSVALSLYFTCHYTYLYPDTEAGKIEVQKTSVPFARAFFLKNEFYGEVFSVIRQKLDLIENFNHIFCGMSLISTSYLENVGDR